MTIGVGENPPAQAGTVTTGVDGGAPTQPDNTHTRSRHTDTVTTGVDENPPTQAGTVTTGVGGGAATQPDNTHTGSRHTDTVTTGVDENSPTQAGTVTTGVDGGAPTQPDNTHTRSRHTDTVTTGVDENPPTQAGTVTTGVDGGAATQPDNTHTRSRRIGAVAMLASGLGFGMSGVFIRSIDADNWQIASWRGLVGSLGVLVYTLVRQNRRRGGQAQLPTGFRLANLAQGLVLMGFGAASMLLLVTSMQKTAVANVSVIIATIPFLAAALGWLLLRERLRHLTVLASVVSFGGVTLTVSGSFGGGRLEGDLYAVCLAMSLASLMVFIRRFGGTDALLAQVGSGILLFAAALAVADPLSIPRSELPLVVLFGLVFATAVILWTEGVRLIPAAEAGLLATSETPCSILLAWIFVSEAPPAVTVVGGLLVLGAVLGHAGADLAHNRVSRPWLRPRTRLRL